MVKIRVSVAGACSLLGQHLLARLCEDPDFVVESLHDRQGSSTGRSLTDATSWHVGSDVLQTYASLPLFSADAPALAPLLLSFLPDDHAEVIESAHLSRGTRVLTHCEYARLKVPMIMPGVSQAVPQAQHLATPNCTTAMCALPLHALQQAFGVTRASITALQAISGTDLPGLSASAIHDQVIGHLPGEATALADELQVLLGNTFPIDTFATRVPVWRGHTLTLSVDLQRRPEPDEIARTLNAVPDILVTGLPKARDSFAPSTLLATITSIRQSGTGVLMVIKGDNLEAATTGVMRSVAISTSVI